FYHSEFRHQAVLPFFCLLSSFNQPKPGRLFITTQYRNIRIKQKGVDKSGIVIILLASREIVVLSSASVLRLTHLK
ncbi:MAG TPA: hypothetical protein PLF13_15000, partial [candidate division Zixibacteria bacterium]|nr:hypothetical protein [candidate division Zixibacteria bacterium]